MGFMVMELAERDTLYDRFVLNEVSSSVEETIQAIRAVALSLREFHQIAMHLDVKLNNFLYVKDQLGNERLKLADFDSARLHPMPSSNFSKKDDRKETASSSNNMQRPKANKSMEMANVRVKGERESDDDKDDDDEFAIGNTLYLSPEQRNREPLSTKTDIWALGMSCIQILMPLLAQIGAANGRIHNLESFNIEIFHREAFLDIDWGKIKRNTKSGTLLDKNDWEKAKGKSSGQLLGLNSAKREYRETLDEWLDKYEQTVELLLSIRVDHPRLLMLIQNILNFEPEQRMTAMGILDFLAGKCQPEMKWAQSKNGQREEVLFNRNVTAGFLAEMVKLKRFSKLKEREFEGLGNWERIGNLLEDGNASWEQFKANLPRRQCDTSSTTIEG